jgi:hypothetical protein
VCGFRLDSFIFSHASQIMHPARKSPAAPY